MDAFNSFIVSMECAGFFDTDREFNGNVKFCFDNGNEAEEAMLLLLVPRGGAEWTLLLGGRDLLFSLRDCFVVDRVARKMREKKKKKVVKFGLISK